MQGRAAEGWYPRQRQPQKGGLSFCIRVAVPNVCYEHLCACVMVAVAAVGVADAICAQQLLLLLYPTRLGYARSEIRPRATAVLVRCFVLPDCPTPRRELCWHQCCWLPIFGRRAYVWMARVDRCRTDSISIWRAMPTAWPGRAHLAGKIQSVPRQKSFRDATKSIAKPTKHVHTGHQATSLNMYPSCATSFARAPPRFEGIPS